MFVNSVKPVLSKLLVLGLAMGACVGGAVMPAAATAAEGDGLSSQTQATSQGSQEYWYSRGKFLTRENIGLGKGELSSRTWMSRFYLETDAQGKQVGMELMWDATNVQERERMSAEAVFPLLLDGQGTDYWLKTRIYSGPFASWSKIYGECEIYRGKPGTPRAKPTSSSPFECVDGWDDSSKPGFTFTVGLVSLAEASGTITSPDVALKDGVFRTDVAYSHPGATELAAGASTRFDALLTEGDTPFYENQARTEFAYQIVDDEKDTGLWVAGLSTNYRGWAKFSGDGRCAIYKGNPLSGAAHLDDQSPIVDTPYTCTAEGGAVHGIGDRGNGHYDATFVVGAK